MKVNYNTVDNIKDKRTVLVWMCTRMLEARLPKTSIATEARRKMKASSTTEKQRSGINEYMREKGIGEDLWNHKKEWGLEIEKHGMP